MSARILIAGSHIRDLECAANLLKSGGCQVRTTTDAALAIAEILAERPDLILVEPALRGMDGMTLAMHLKADPRTRDIQIVAWTDATATHSSEYAVAAGCDGVIIKSPDAGTLAAEITPFLFPAVSACEHETSQRRSLRILLVDDSSFNRELLAMRLSSAGHFTLQAADGVQALSILEAEKVDAVISDVLMPSMDGYQLCHKIRGNPRLKDVPVIICSGALISPASELLASELGAVRFLRKPFSQDRILATLREVVSEAEHRRDQLGSGGIVSSSTDQTERLIEQLETKNGKLREATEQLLQTQHELLVLSRRLEDREEMLREKNAQLEEELRMARETHLALLPRCFPSLPTGTPPGESAILFHQRFVPKGTVSGDFFDISALSDTKAGVFICDAMGHDVRAALVTALIRGVLSEVTKTVSDPGEVLTAINRTLVPILRQAGAPMFASAFYMTANAADGEIRYANAGHPSPFLVRRDTGKIESLGVLGRAHGPALGFMEDSLYPTGRRVMVPHDLVVLFTDGVFEVDGQDEEPFGQERLKEAVHSRIGLPPEQLFNEILEEVHRFSLIDDFEDDVCLVGMEVDHLC